MKAHRIISQIFLYLLISLLFPAFLLGQQEEVRVVKPYSPTLSGAKKIELLPGAEEEIRYDAPEIVYKLYPKRYESKFSVQPIKPARMVQMPLEKLYKSRLTLGMGNYLTPLAELRINQLRSRNGTFGLVLKHHSMNGKVKLDNDLKVPAGFNENSGKIYGSRFLKKGVFDYYAGASYNAYVHYGVDPELDTVLAREDALHPYFKAEGGIGLHSVYADSFHFNYDASLDYYYFTHRFNQTEHGAEARFDFNKRLTVIDLAGETGVKYLGHYPGWDTIMGNDQFMAWLNPHVAKSTPEWRFSAGFNTYLEVSNSIVTPHFYPRAMFRFNMVKEVIVPYFGVDGYLELNSFLETVEENPYVVPGLPVRPTSHKMIGYMGLKGRFSDAVAYNIRASYSIIDDAYFYVNDNSNPLMNQFTIVYDDITLARLHGELTIRPTDAWKIFLKGNYYHYVMVREDHPWNKPQFDVSAEARYNMSDKIIINAGIYAIGARYFENFNPALEETLPLTVDANLGLEYRYSKLLSFWARFNNMAAQKYYLYNNYPSYRFRVMLGLTYAL